MASRKGGPTVVLPRGRLAGVPPPTLGNAQGTKRMTFLTPPPDVRRSRWTSCSIGTTFIFALLVCALLGSSLVVSSALWRGSSGIPLNTGGSLETHAGKEHIEPSFAANDMGSGAGSLRKRLSAEQRATLQARIDALRAKLRKGGPLPKDRGTSRHWDDAISRAVGAGRGASSKVLVGVSRARGDDKDAEATSGKPPRGSAPVPGPQSQQRISKRADDLVDPAPEPATAAPAAAKHSRAEVAAPAPPPPAAAVMPVAGEGAVGAGLHRHAPSSHVPLLVIGIPSVPRRGGEDYLLRTLRYIVAQQALPSQGTGDALGPYPLRVRVVVLNNRRPGPEGDPASPAGDYEAGEATHAVFAAARRELCGAQRGGCAPRKLSVPGSSWEGGASGPATHHVMAAGEDDDTDPVPGVRVSFAVNGRPVAQDGDDAGTPDHPGYRVRRQTRDVSDLLDVVTALYGGSGDYYMFMEDDFRLCPHGLQALAFLLARASAPGHAGATGDWNAIRVSFGLNGAIIRMPDVPVLGAYYSQHVARRPPDHLTVEWFAGEKPQSAGHKRGRPHVAFRYNLLEHFGQSSSLREASSGGYALCYADMDERVVFEVEMFRAGQCGHDVLTPCLPKDQAEAAAAQGALPPPGPDLDFDALRANAKADSVQVWV